MPIYEFLCECGHRFEKFCRVKDTPSLKCPLCGGDGRRVMSAFRVGRSPGGDAAGVSAAGSACSGCSSTSCAGCSSH